MIDLTKFPCPACGDANSAEHKWSGELEAGKEGEYSGLWIECRSCGLQGPKKIWLVMAHRRKIIQGALGVEISPLESVRGKYAIVIEDFARRMFDELIANDPKKGNFLTWTPDKEGAVKELEHHFIKLVGAINRGHRPHVTEFSADLANICMGIESVHGLPEVE